MGLTEFDIIKKYFTQNQYSSDVVLGVGDDAALVNLPENKQLVITVDTLISGTHFPENTPPEDIAYKAIAVNLSDLAAMGATPAYLTLALTMPDSDETWLQSFSSEFLNTCKKYKIQLLGGDTTRGDLSITVQAMGYIDQGKSMQRSNAKVEDSIYVTGYLGDAAIGLKILNGNSDVDINISNYCKARLNRPTPRVEFSTAAKSFCRCAIDISDGLLADLGHILKTSNLGAELLLDDIPVSKEAQAYYEQKQQVIDWNLILAGGDDYELCLVVPKEHESSIELLAVDMGLPIRKIGKIVQDKGIYCINNNGNVVNLQTDGFRHF